MFTRLSDPRDRRGVRHTLPVVLTITLTAMLAGAKSFAALGQWAKTLTQATADRLGIDTRPETSTIRRVLSALDPVLLDALTGAWMWLRCRQVSGRVVVSFDAKTVPTSEDDGHAIG